MGIFKRKQKEEEIDNRTEIEKKFEEKGQTLGRKTGTIVQKSVNKFDSIKQSLEEKGTMDKVRNVQNKIDDAVDKVVDSVSHQAKKVTTKFSKKDTQQDNFYE